MGNMSEFFNWCVATCNAPNTGYSQKYRRGQTVNGITYYDCSSFVSAGLTYAGFFTTNPWFTTHDERQRLQSIGFLQMDARRVPWKKGDILWRTGHTEVVYRATDNGGITMGAHTDGIPLVDQVSINKSSTNKSAWNYLYRCEQSVRNWIGKNAYLNELEKQNNAICFLGDMSAYEFCYESIVAMLGNIEQESGINPGIYNNLKPGVHSAYGLVQWLPSTNYTDWARAKHYDIADGTYQCEWIATETVPKGQWIPTKKYPDSFEEFKTNVKGHNMHDLVEMFLLNFERASSSESHLEKRILNAMKWYDFLKDIVPEPPQPLRKNNTKLMYYLFL